MGYLDIKNKLRITSIERRRQFSTQLSAFSIHDYGERVYQNLFPLLKEYKDEFIGTYWPMRDEFDVKPVNERLKMEGYQLCYPRIDEHHSIQFHLIEKEEDLIKNRFGFQEPHQSARPCNPRVFLVPMVAFDERCHRLGYGKGHFDRALHQARSQHKVLAIGIAYDMQRIDNIPIESTDQQMDYVVTEKAIYKSRNS